MRPNPASRSGFTIMELLVTIGLAAFLMTLGASMFISGGQGTAYKQAISDVSAMISTVRDRSSSVPSSLVLDPENGTVHALTSRTVQELHFEPAPSDGDEIIVAMGIGDREVLRNDGQFVGDGRVGGGAAPDAGPGRRLR